MKRSTNVIVSNLSRDNILFSTFYTGLFLLFRKKTGGARAPPAPPLATALHWASWIIYLGMDLRALEPFEYYTWESTDERTSPLNNIPWESTGELTSHLNNIPWESTAEPTSRALWIIYLGNRLASQRAIWIIYLGNRLPSQRAIWIIYLGTTAEPTSHLNNTLESTAEPTSHFN